MQYKISILQIVTNCSYSKIYQFIKICRSHPESPLPYILYNHRCCFQHTYHSQDQYQRHNDPPYSYSDVNGLTIREGRATNNWSFISGPLIWAACLTSDGIVLTVDVWASNWWCIQNNHHYPPWVNHTRFIAICVIESFYNALHISAGYCPKMSISATFMKETSRQKNRRAAPGRSRPAVSILYTLCWRLSTVRFLICWDTADTGMLRSGRGCRRSRDQTCRPSCRWGWSLSQSPQCRRDGRWPPPPPPPVLTE